MHVHHGTELLVGHLVQHAVPGVAWWWRGGWGVGAGVRVGGRVCSQQRRWRAACASGGAGCGRNGGATRPHTHRGAAHTAQHAQPGQHPPAQLTRMCRPPQASTAAATARGANPGSVTSPASASAAPQLLRMKSAVACATGDDGGRSRVQGAGNYADTAGSAREPGGRTQAGCSQQLLREWLQLLQLRTWQAAASRSLHSTRAPCCANRMAACRGSHSGGRGRAAQRSSCAHGVMISKGFSPAPLEHAMQRAGAHRSPDAGARTRHNRHLRWRRQAGQGRLVPFDYLSP